MTSKPARSNICLVFDRAGFLYRQGRINGQGHERRGKWGGEIPISAFLLAGRVAADPWDDRGSDVEG